MPSPFGDCESSVDYVQSECLAECEANYVISNCSCKDVYMPGEPLHQLYLNAYGRGRNAAIRSSVWLSVCMSVTYY